MYVEGVKRTYIHNIKNIKKVMSKNFKSPYSVF